MKQNKTSKQKPAAIRESFGTRAKKDFRKNWGLYLMVLPVLIYYLIFCYAPMYGALIAFKDYKPRLGIIGSPWAAPAFKHFISFFKGPYFYRLVRNTLKISLTSLFWGFPAPIILALMINELKSKWFTKVSQTITYLPHFISLVVICGMISTFTNKEGFINDIVALFGGQRTTMLTKPEYFVPIYVISDIWQGIGWGSIIYLSALAGIDQELYEAATLDGAGRLRQTWHVTLPGILPTIIIMLILRLGGLMSVGYEKIILLENPLTYETAEVISSHVYQKGIVGGVNQYSYATAVGLFNSAINCLLVVAANKLSRSLTETSLW